VSEPWLCESVRLTALWQTPENFASSLQWETVVGAPPEIKEDQPRRGVSRQAGPINEGSATLEVQSAPGRVDWVMAPVLTGTALEVSTFPNIGLPEDALGKFETLLFEKAMHVYGAPRLALGVIAIRPAPDRDASYAELSALLKSIHPDFSGASEVIFQINRPRLSLTLPGLTLNRLSRWSSIAFAGMQFVLSAAPGMSGTAAHRFSKPLNGVRAELDLSSAADRAEEIPAATRVPLLREFCRLALEILEKGEIP
jgi:hypothetical protein